MVKWIIKEIDVSTGCDGDYFDSEPEDKFIGINQTTEKLIVLRRTAKRG